MNRSFPTQRTFVGLGLDGAGMGPGSSDGQTRLTRGEDYILLGGSDELHGAMQDVIEALAETCREEGTTLGTAPRELLAEIFQDFGEDLPDNFDDDFKGHLSDDLELGFEDDLDEGRFN